MTAQQLKNSILQLAVQGKLVPQDPNDESATILLERIRAEKQRLVKEGKIRKEKPLPPISEDEISFDIPESWEWVRLKDLCTKIGSGSTPMGGKAVYIDNGVKFIRSQNVYDNGLRLDNIAFISKKTNDEKIGSYVHPNDILLNITGGSIGRCALVPNDFDGANVNQHVMIIRLVEAAITKYLHFVIISSYIQNMIMGVQVGVSREGLSATKLMDFLIPLPPLAEQQRIVEHIEQLLPHIADYDTAEQKLTALNATFPNQLKKSILQAAVQGKLVPQDENDEPASVLLERIRVEKEQLVKDSKLKKEKPMPTVSEDEISFDIPKSWEWVRLGNLVYNHGQLAPCTDFCYIDIGSIDNKKQLLSEQENILSADKAPSRARKVVMIGDILYSTVRPYLHNMCIVDRKFSHAPIASTGFAVMACYYGLFNRFLYYYLLSPDFDNYANHADNSKGVAYPAINDTRLYNAIIPIPPLTEQLRIVTKCDKLMTMIDNLGGNDNDDYISERF